MKHSNKQTFTLVLALAMLSFAAAGALAEDKVTYENGQLTIECEDSDKLIILDTDGMQDFVSDVLHETMDDMSEVLAELDDMQLEIRLGDDNQLSIETEDQMWEMNLDVIFQEIGTALETAFEDIDSDDWTSHHHWDVDFDDDDDDYNDEDLEAELEDLKDELRKLHKELQSLKEL